ncbi:hypothetical protein SAMN04488498_1394 [Mesorhizobium albiziae]|uniref:Uncharacterized protein n=1 Tax=Neomesorhizobium albiziae TaxID=335020 RepID=A0A1I4F7W1_9HYPH|nr:hypothetical protein [Mesorhizobium albiziae]GLS30727.1 hypothetical protein GCM10007937_24350 [Mesorhizobium albiziae]SFL14062.1 hypothetical protein SAMN04488498_1394 [Mesorhizobium albiziae]
MKSDKPLPITKHIVWRAYKLVDSPSSLPMVMSGNFFQANLVGPLTKGLEIFRPQFAGKPLSHRRRNDGYGQVCAIVPE